MGASLHCLCDLPIAAVPEISLIGDAHVYHKRGDLYVDSGAEAKVRLEDGNYMDVVIRTASNPVPSPCDTVGKYVVEYEAVGPYGFTSRVERIVEVGQFTITHIIEIYSSGPSILKLP